MMLKIICQNSNRYKENIEKLCKASKIFQYEILDPRSHDLKKTFQAALILGDISLPGFKANKLWQTLVPTSDMEQRDKVIIFKEFQKAGLWADAHRENKVARKGDVPPLKTLKEFLNKMNGEVVEIVLEDKRLLGIYPDGEPLKMRYDIEYHASSIVNLSRLQEIFNPSKILIKEV